MTDDIQDTLGRMVERGNNAVRRQWAYAAMKWTTNGLEAMARGDMTQGAYALLISADCAKMAKNAPCKMTPLLQAIYEEMS